MKSIKFPDKEIINGVTLLLLGIWIWWYSGKFPSQEEGYPGPALFPRLISVGLAGCGLGLLLSRSSEESAESDPVSGDWLRLSLGAVLICLYPILQPVVGFFPSLTGVCFGMGILLRVKLWVAAVTALLTAGLLQTLFSNLLGVAL